MKLQQLRNAYQAFVQEDKRQCRLHEEFECGTEFIVCTKGARWLQKHFFPGSRVMGYYIEDNPTALVGADTDGHDFLLVDGRYLVDFWPRRVEGERYPIAFDLQTQRESITHYYGDPDCWEDMTE